MNGAHVRLCVPPAAVEEVRRAPLSSDFDMLYREHSAYVAAIAYRLLGRDDEMDDIVQEVFLRAVRDLREMRGVAAAKGWLAVTTTRFVRRRLRLRRLRSVFRLDPVDVERIPGAPTPDAALLASVYSALDRMPTDLRIAWLLKHAAGEQLETVASACGCSLATVKRRIQTAQRMLEDRLR